MFLSFLFNAFEVYFFHNISPSLSLSMYVQVESPTVSSSSLFQSIPPPAKTSYNVIFLVVVGNVLAQGPDDNHAEYACK